MNTELKKALLIFGGGLLIFWAFQKMKPIGADSKKPKKKDKEDTKDASKEDKKNAVIMKKAYIDAMKAGESKAFLQEMNQEFYSKYQMKIMPDKTSGKLIVVDSDGNKVI